MPEQKIVKASSVDKLLQQSLLIEEQTAKERGALGYMCRALALTTMPHSDPGCRDFTRRNGNFIMTMTANPHPDLGLPYGTVPRILMGWISTEAVRGRQREIELGGNLSSFMAKIDMVPTGGRWGTIPRLRKQILRLFTSSISAYYANYGATRNPDLPEGAFGLSFPIASRFSLWWDPKLPDQGSLWTSSVVLGEDFFKEVINHPVPIDWDAVKALRRSPLALDIYFWLTHRFSRMDKPTHIPWLSLQLQFGAGYPETIRGRIDFRRKFGMQLSKVLSVYRQARVEDGGTDGGLILIPSPTHVRRT